MESFFSYLYDGVSTPKCGIVLVILRGVVTVGMFK